MNAKLLLLLPVFLIGLLSCSSDKKDDEPQTRREIDFSLSEVNTFHHSVFSKFGITVPENDYDYYIINSMEELDRLPTDILPKDVRDRYANIILRHNTLLLVRRYVSQSDVFQSFENVRIFKTAENSLEIIFYSYMEEPVTDETDPETIMLQFFPFIISRIPENTQVTFKEKPLYN